VEAGPLLVLWEDRLYQVRAILGEADIPLEAVAPPVAEAAGQVRQDQQVYLALQVLVVVEQRLPLRALVLRERVVGVAEAGDVPEEQAAQVVGVLVPLMVAELVA